MAKIYTLGELPKTLPLFPLNGVTLLPRMQFPLSIDEPHAINMIDDALRGDRMIGIIQPKHMDDLMPPLYAIGTGARIASFDETDDGKYIIGATGVCRFRLHQEIPTPRDYRVGEVEWDMYAEDLQIPDTYHFQRRALIGQLQDFFNHSGIDVDWDAIGRTPDALLVNSLSILCPFGVPEKQALLEATSVGDRLATLQTILAFANAPSPAALRVLN